MKQAVFAPDPSRARAAVERCPMHAVTPLRPLEIDGVTVRIKDEGARFGIGSFKALGGVYAIMRSLCDLHEVRTGVRPSIEALFEHDRRALHAEVDFVCASAGNHGIAVATGAALLGARARVHLSDEVPEDFAARLRARGAEVVRSGADYQQSLDAALADAAGGGGRLIADTAWDGYVDVPAGIMEGYTMVGEELVDAFTATGDWPSDVYLQAGVGGLAGALTWHIRHRWAVQPRIVIVEPEAAPCLAVSARTGTVATVAGPASNMGRLDCKSASPLAVHALRDADVDYLAVSDASAEVAVQRLAGLGVSTTPSGAAGFAAWLQERVRTTAAGGSPLVIVSEAGIGDGATPDGVGGGGTRAGA